MVSSKVMLSSTSRKSDLSRRSSPAASTKLLSIFEAQNHDIPDNIQLKPKKRRKNKEDKNNSNFVSMTVDGLLRNVCGGVNQVAEVESTLLDAEITLLDAAGAVMAFSDSETNDCHPGTTMPAIRRQESSVLNSAPANKTADDVWKEIVAGRSDRRECKQEAPDEIMTLEVFLAKAEAMDEGENAKVPQAESLSGGVFAFAPMPLSPFPTQQGVDGVIGFGNGVEVIGGRGKRRDILEPLDRAAQQRQRRMIKNRESAAKSRERKQAYQVELESLAVKLEEENEKLKKEKAERTRERYKQLMKKIVPVVERRKPRHGLSTLRRVHSLHW
ncbi:hypothetical protein NMG60_11031556 [Bertholletia excelsa]